MCGADAFGGALDDFWQVGEQVFLFRATVAGYPATYPATGPGTVDQPVPPEKRQVQRAACLLRPGVKLRVHGNSHATMCLSPEQVYRAIAVRQSELAARCQSSSGR